MALARQVAMTMVMSVMVGMAVAMSAMIVMCAQNRSFPAPLSHTLCGAARRASAIGAGAGTMAGGSCQAHRIRLDEGEGSSGGLVARLAQRVYPGHPFGLFYAWLGLFP